MRTIAILLAMVLFLSSRTAHACGTDSDCRVVNGSYRVRLPATPSERPFGATVFFHGWQQSAEDVMNDQALTAVAERLGVALVALDGEQKTWSFPSSPHYYRDDFNYVYTVREDIGVRFPIDRTRLLGAGFSQGASMLWYLACRQPRLFTAFAPVSGAFWRPAPRTCAAPLPVLLHLHGVADTTVPLKGREVAPGIRQDSVRDSFAVLGPSAPLNVLPRVAANFISGAPLTCERSAQRPDGGLLELCLHAGGHEFIATWIEHAWHLAADRRSR